MGEPLPPLLNIPARVTDLAAVQRGSHVIAQFSVPRLSTEGAVLKRPVRVELHAGPSTPGNFDEAAWAASAKLIPPGPIENSRARYLIPVGDWPGKEVIFGVKVYGANGRDAGWSNLVALAVVAPPQQPAALRAEPAPDGVHLAWQGHGESFRVYRRAAGELGLTAVANTAAPEWTDTHAEFGKPYQYEVQAIAKTATGEAESEPSEPISITPVDRFPPATPGGLTAVPATASIELIWERNNEPDLAGYRIYRAVGQAPFVKLAETQQAPSYSDRNLVSGTTYRYAVSAVDKAGNESKLSQPVEATAP